jgi:hypothetical protein
MNMRNRELGKNLVSQVRHHPQHNLLHSILLENKRMDSSRRDTQHLSRTGNFLLFWLERTFQTFRPPTVPNTPSQRRYQLAFLEFQ